MQAAAKQSVTKRRRVRKTPLTDDMIVRWIGLFYEKEKYYPTADTKLPVWDKDADGNWIDTGENWPSLEKALQKGRRGLLEGSSLRDLKDASDYNRKLTHKLIIKLIKLFYEKEKRYPTTTNGEDGPDPVWNRDEDGQWVKLKDSWVAIDHALKTGSRGIGDMQGKMTLAKFKQKHGFLDNLTEKKICEWIVLFCQKENRWPNQDDEPVYARGNHDIVIVLEHESWAAIDMALRHQRRGLNGTPRSLSKLKERMRTDPAYANLGLPPARQSPWMDGQRRPKAKPKPAVPGENGS